MEWWIPNPRWLLFVYRGPFVAAWALAFGLTLALHLRYACRATRLATLGFGIFFLAHLLGLLPPFVLSSRSLPLPSSLIPVIIYANFFLHSAGPWLLAFSFAWLVKRESVYLEGITVRSLTGYLFLGLITFPVAMGWLVGVVFAVRGLTDGSGRTIPRILSALGFLGPLSIVVYNAFSYGGGGWFLEGFGFFHARIVWELAVPYTGFPFLLILSLWLWLHETASSVYR